MVKLDFGVTCTICLLQLEPGRVFFWEQLIHGDKVHDFTPTIYSYFDTQYLAMARKVNMIDEINDTKETWKLAIRIINLWSVEKSPMAGIIEMIFMDKKGDKIQAQVKKFDMEKWKSQLKEGSCYIVQNFQVQSNSGQYKTTTHPYKLIFVKGTIAKENDLIEIPHHIYHFTGFDDIISGHASADVLIDVIGEFVGLVQDNRNGNPRKVVFNLKDQGSTTLSCTLWEDYCSRFWSFMDKHESGPVIVLLTLAKIKDSKGKYATSIQNSYYGSKLLINENIVEIQNFKEKLESIHGNYDSYTQTFTQLSSCSQAASEDNFLQNLEVKTITEIKQLKQEYVCVTVATIDKVFANGWSYESCSKCNKKVVSSASGYMCPQCHREPVQTVARFRLEVMVSNNRDSAKFILWDRECYQLIKHTAFQLKKQLIDEGEDDPMAFPEAIDCVLGKRLAFRVKAQPTFNRSSVLQVSEDDQIIESVVLKFPIHEDNASTEKGKSICSLQKEHELYDSQCYSATADYDPDLLGSLTPAKRLSFDTQFDDVASEDFSSVQQSSTKLTKHIKTE